MLKESTEVEKIVRPLIADKLKPHVKKVDAEAFYAEEYLKSLGEAGLLNSPGHVTAEVVAKEMTVVEETAKSCMTTAFNLWCHLASLTYVRSSANKELKDKLLRLLEDGSMLGATGLSNPMKSYAGLETLSLKAEKTDDGYILNGSLPSVSNLGSDHWFGIVASTDQGNEVMALVSCGIEGLIMKEKAEYLGVNGSATYACQLKNVHIPSTYIISEDASEFVKTIRPYFVLYQIPLGFGVTDASIKSIEKASAKQNGANAYLSVQADELAEELENLRKRADHLVKDINWSEILKVRLEAVKLTLKAVQADMLHNGGPAYLQKSHPARRLREAYFFANLTPTIRHLEKMLAN
ncbi:acyl-CoA dehydrogenase [Jeotgalibacillus malaysiensis]|uniref:Acyl-CoA dehydrogenase n=1 Tax=Jeotgalibacillus malaysiensis TaxID=1508404 RepID=A0A0B5AJ56_9BACL|nr:acyl-CoA dehydrogenase family protein [Jeotgalibacillus malaysiensis]AJD90370.1 acyl-CoA dehydrogenase [Jeotgalibacillus malaysiensis]